MSTIKLLTKEVYDIYLSFFLSYSCPRFLKTVWTVLSFSVSLSLSFLSSCFWSHLIFNLISREYLSLSFLSSLPAFDFSWLSLFSFLASNLIQCNVYTQHTNYQDRQTSGTHDNDFASKGLKKDRQVQQLQSVMNGRKKSERHDIENMYTYSSLSFTRNSSYTSQQFIAWFHFLLILLRTKNEIKMKWKWVNSMLHSILHPSVT